MLLTEVRIGVFVDPKLLLLLVNGRFSTLLIGLFQI